jgi:uridine phosphorylase
MKRYQYATLKKIVAEADDIDATLHLLRESGVVSHDEAQSIQSEIETPEIDVLPTFDEIIAALEEEGCHNIAKELHTILTSDADEPDASEEDSAGEPAETADEDES